MQRIAFFYSFWFIVAPLPGTYRVSKALGFGANATDGRKRPMYQITNLYDTGAGSFGDAVDAPNRIVVFDLEGYITLKSAVLVKSNTTIAGQMVAQEGCKRSR